MPLGEKLEGGRYIDTENGLIMPWYTSPCLEWLLTLDLKGKRVFEYGVGDSTQWYRRKGATVHGVDSNYMWASVANVDVFKDKDHYIESLGYCVMKDGFFDMVAIDGDYRDGCTEMALVGLRSGGYIIIDNYHQSSVEPNIWTQTDRLIKGMPITVYKEPDHYDWQTAVITKP